MPRQKFCLFPGGAVPPPTLPGVTELVAQEAAQRAKVVRNEQKTRQSLEVFERQQMELLEDDDVSETSPPSPVAAFPLNTIPEMKLEPVHHVDPVEEAASDVGQEGGSDEEAEESTEASDEHDEPESREVMSDSEDLETETEAPKVAPIRWPRGARVVSDDEEESAHHVTSPLSRTVPTLTLHSFRKEPSMPTSLTPRLKSCSSARTPPCSRRSPSIAKSPLTQSSPGPAVRVDPAATPRLQERKSVNTKSPSIGKRSPASSKSPWAKAKAPGCESKQDSEVDELGPIPGVKGVTVRTSAAEKAVVLRCCYGNTSVELDVPLSTWGRLYPHQKAGVAWLLVQRHRTTGNHPGGGILADEMGLGKTVQMLTFLDAALHYRKADYGRSALIVVPPSILTSWQKHSAQWCPRLRMVTLTSDHNSATRSNIVSALKQTEKPTVLLTTYGMLQSLGKRNQLLNKVNWDYVVLDEGHVVKNPSSQTAKAAKALHSHVRFILTGTPIQNCLEEFWALFLFIDSRVLGPNGAAFKREFAEPIKKGLMRGATELARKRSVTLSEKLKELYRNFLLQRKKDILEKAVGLNTKIDIVVWCGMTSLQREVYQKYLDGDDVRNCVSKKEMTKAICMLTNLRKLCNHLWLQLSKSELTRSIADRKPIDTEEMVGHLIDDCAKMQALLKIFEIGREEGERLLIFSQSVKMLEIIRSVLTHAFPNVKLSKLDGETKHKERQELVDRFNSDTSIEALLLTTGVGGVGLTLTGATRVVIFDPDWNPTKDSQAIGRAHRIGQKKQVVVYRLMTCGGVEEFTYRQEIFKECIAHRTTHSASSLRRYFTHMDLHAMFNFDPEHQKTLDQLTEIHKLPAYPTNVTNSIARIRQISGIRGFTDHDAVFKLEDPASDPPLDASFTEDLSRRRTVRVASKKKRAKQEETVADVLSSLSPGHRTRSPDPYASRKSCSRAPQDKDDEDMLRAAEMALLGEDKEESPTESKAATAEPQQQPQAATFHECEEPSPAKHATARANSLSSVRAVTPHPPARESSSEPCQSMHTASPAAASDDFKIHCDPAPPLHHHHSHDYSVDTRDVDSLAPAPHPAAGLGLPPRPSNCTSVKLSPSIRPQSTPPAYKHVAFQQPPPVKRPGNNTGGGKRPGCLNCDMPHFKFCPETGQPHARGPSTGSGSGSDSLHPCSSVPRSEDLGSCHGMTTPSPLRLAQLPGAPQRRARDTPETSLSSGGSVQRELSFHTGRSGSMASCRSSLRCHSEVSHLSAPGAPSRPQQSEGGSVYSLGGVDRELSFSSRNSTQKLTPPAIQQVTPCNLPRGSWDHELELDHLHHYGPSPCISIFTDESYTLRRSVQMASPPQL